MIKIVACAMIDFHRVQTRLIAGTNLEAATTDLPGNDPPAKAEADLFADL